ncbi:hypothetical protein [Amycolatopsis sp. NPDC051061]|uniref:hypothetical protein n=1 Tax=Amycolatopsis sp. NPDC051061 TaxID=3155042 RepID=UPI00343D463A
MLPEHLDADVRTLWDYHDLRHEPRRSDAGIGLGSRDPGVDVVCASKAVSFEDHLTGEEDADRVISMLVGETQRITEYAARGFAIPQDFPHGVERAFGRLAAAGFTQRLL